MTHPLNRGSVALVLVLITTALMMAVVLEIVYRSQVSKTVVTNRRDAAKAYELARAAFQWSLFRLQLDSSLDQIPVVPNTNYGGKKDDLTEIQWAVPISYPMAVENATSFLQGASSPQQPSTSSMATDIGGSFVSSISDESSRININDVGSGGPPGHMQWSGASEILENLLLSYRFRRFFKTSQAREILWAIDDWIDADSEVNHLGGGIEDAEYQIEDQTYHVKNSVFYTVSELRMLKPMTHDIFQQLKPFLTVYPFDARIPRVSSQPVFPVGKINVNTASMELIAAILSREAISNLRQRLDCAQKFVKTRQNIVFRSIRGQEPSFIGFLSQACPREEGQSGAVSLITPAVEKTLDFRSDLFRIEATGTAGAMDKTIEAVVWRRDPTKIRILYWRVV